MIMKIPLIILCALSLALAGRAAETPVTLKDFKLTGDLSGGRAGFTLTATAVVQGAKGGSLELLSGPVALTGVDPKTVGHIGVGSNTFLFDIRPPRRLPHRSQFQRGCDLV